MTARHYYRFDQDEAVAEVPNVLRWSYAGQQKAEEGEAGMYEIVVDDPDMTLDFRGHRRWTIYEDESDDDNQVIIDGLTQAVRVAHKGGDITQPHGRVWTIEIADMNTLWTYRVMTGGDAHFDAQTDVERMQQLADSEEFGYFDQTYLSTDDPVDMDEVDGRGQTTGQIADQCGQESGKNWYIFSEGVTTDYSAEIFLWYGFDSLETRTSPLALSNEPADLVMPDVNDGSAVTYPIGKDTSLRRDYARQYSGFYGEYQNGAKYYRDPVIAEEITVTGRDMVYPAPEIKTKARMAARLRRVARDHATPDEVISTTITLPANKVSQLRAGMRVAFRATHEPGYENFRYLRIMSAAIKPIGRRYEVTIELQGPGTSEPIETVTLVATNTVQEDGGRNASDTEAGVSFEVGQVWRWTLTNTQHASIAITDKFGLVWHVSANELIRAWGITVHYVGTGFPTFWTPQVGPPYPAFNPDTGTFVITETGSGYFSMDAGANYAPGTVSIDEQWTCVLERLS